MARPTRDELLASLRAAFPASALPRARVARGHSDEGTAIAQVLGGRAWTDVRPEEFQQNGELRPQDLPAFLSDEAVAATLPLLFDMATDLDSEFDIAEELALTLRSRPLEIAVRLDSRQRQMLLESLEWLADELEQRGVADSGPRRTLDEVHGLLTEDPRSQPTESQPKPST